MKTKSIKRWALDNDVTWVMIAHESGVSRQQVSHIIYNRRTDTGHAVRQALCFLGCPTRHLGQTK